MENSTESRWHLFLALEMLLCPLAVAVGRQLSPEAGPPEWSGNTFLMWALGSLPILFATIGRGFVVALADDIGWFYCPEEEALWKELLTRPSLDDTEFHSRFYKASGIPGEVTAGIRQILRDVYCDEVNRLIPPDDLRYIDVDLGIECMIFLVERAFRIAIHRDPADYGKIDFSLDGMIRLVHQRAKGNPPWADDAIG